MQEQKEHTEEQQQNYPIKLYLQPAIWQALKKQAEEEESSLSLALREKITRGYSANVQVPEHFKPVANQGGRGIRGAVVGPPMNVRLPYGWLELFKNEAQLQGLQLRPYIRHCIIKALILEQKI